MFVIELFNCNFMCLVKVKKKPFIQNMREYLKPHTATTTIIFMNNIFLKKAALEKLIFFVFLLIKHSINNENLFCKIKEKNH